MAAALPITLLSNIKPYKTAWRIQVKILHTWKHYTPNSGETLEMVLADEEGTKIHASLKKHEVVRYEKYLPQGQWKCIQHINLNHAIGQYRPTDHPYKLSFVKETWISNSDNVSNNIYLSLPSFNSIHEGEQNQSVLCDILGQVVNVGELVELEAFNKPTKKIEFELRDATDFRVGCTLWGSFAEKIFEASQNSGNERIICLIRFAKIREYRGVISVSNAFNASTLEINPTHHEVQNFVSRLPKDGLSLTLLDSKPAYVSIHNEFWNECDMTPIVDLISKTEVGRTKIQCIITGIDTDWGWYYISCTKTKHKKVFKAIPGSNEVVDIDEKPKWWCELCKKHVTDVVGKYKLHLKVKDESGETNLLLFDTIANEIVKEKANNLLKGNFDEIEDPEDLPPSIEALVGKTFQFGVVIENENLNRGHDTFRVIKVMTTNGMIACDSKQESDLEPTPSELISGDQTLMLRSSEDTSGSDSIQLLTPSSKRKDVQETSMISDQSSVTKKPRFRNVKLENVKTDNVVLKKGE